MPIRKTANPSVASIQKALAGMAMAGKGAYYPKKSNVSGRGAYKKRTVRGHGFYKGFGSDLGRFLGGAVGQVTGNPGLSELGSKLGQMGANATGWGAYKVHHNSIMADIPVVSNPHKEGATQIRHREYIGDVLSSGSFNVQYKLPINVGQQPTFPWASVVGQAYQQFQINGMLFEFVSSSGDTTSGNTNLGTICMATQYDSVLPPFTTKQQMLNQEFSTSAKPSVNSLHPIECAPNQTSIPLLYTRTQVVPAGTDQRLYDLGQFYLATEGQQVDNQVLGELWVTYDILLYKPMLGGEAGVEPSSGSGVSHIQLRNTSPVGHGIFGSSRTEIRNDLGVVVKSFVASNDTLTLPAGSVGTFWIQIWLYCSASGISVPTHYTLSSISSGAAQVDLFGADTAGFADSFVGLGSSTLSGQNYCYNTCVNIPTAIQTDVTLTWTLAGSTPSDATTWSSGDVFVLEVPRSLTN